MEIVVSWYGVSVVFPWLKRLHVIFWIYQNVLAVLLFTFTHFSTLLMTVYQKCCWVNILWNPQRSSLQCCDTIKEFGQKYCDIYSFYHLSRSHLLDLNKLSVTSYMISNYQYRLIWNLTIVIGFSAVLPRPTLICGQFVQAAWWKC